MSFFENGMISTSKQIAPRAFATCAQFLMLSVSACLAEPVALWDFEDGGGELESVGAVNFVNGPDQEVAKNLPKANRAAHFSGKGDRIVVADSEALRFDQGDAITVEAWVRLEGDAANSYIIGKGRLAAGEDNQNWALRLMKVGENFRLSFLFRSRAGGSGEGDEGKEAEFHRWNSKAGIKPGKLWHHVAVSYRFGEPGSIRGFLDGEKTRGEWDLGGATKRPPVVDKAEVWIGSSRGGLAGNSLRGALDQLAVHREILSEEVLAARSDFGGGPKPVEWDALPKEGVQVDVFEGLKKHAWLRRVSIKPHSFPVPAMALTDLPTRYAEDGSRQRRAATLIRMAARVELVAGEHAFLLRAPSLARLSIDGEEVASLKAHSISKGAQAKLRPAAEPMAYPRARLGTRDHIIRFTSPGGTHEVVLEAVIGDKKMRFTAGQLLVAKRDENGAWKLLGGEREFSPVGMERYRQELAAQFVVLADAARAKARIGEVAIWEKRHTAARVFVESLPALAVPPLPEGFAAGNAIDHFLARKIHASQMAEAETDPHAAMARGSLAILEEQCFRCHGSKDKGDLRLDSRAAALLAGESGELAIVPGSPDASEVMLRITSTDEDERMPPKGDGMTETEISKLRDWIDAGAPWANSSGSVSIPPTLDDDAFLRRLFLDTVGILPTPDEIRDFRNDSSEDKVERRVAALLADPRHADHWTGYWQDVLAENPRLVKGMLNNTGAFRYWIHEALRDKLPFDAFVHELVAGKGTSYEGGARGFRIASENDAPAAAKAHILATAFLGTEMKCARCHDAPYHSSTQRQLFELAAMLEGKPLSVPASSTVPATFFTRLDGRKSLVEVTLDQGVPVNPEWPFESFGETDAKSMPTRDRLAWELTRPENRRFAQVIVNRVWKRYFGQGFVEPASDWEGNEPSHPELLDFLARDFVAHGYDLDRLSTLILTCSAYRREARLRPALPAAERMFEAPVKRRLSAEQLVDSLFAATGVPIYSEELTFDLEGTKKAETFQNLGRPSRAWEFVSLASDRDRPSLTLPYAESIVSVMQAFGWREDRSEPVTERESEATVLQPGMLANGVFGTWITRLSPYSDLTNVAVNADSARAFLDDLYLRFLGREPGRDERAALLPALEEGFAQRLQARPETFVQSTFVPEVREVTWSNHLSPEANIYATEIGKRVEQGPPVAEIFEAGWRARAEDVVWAIVNSPELQFVP